MAGALTVTPNEVEAVPPLPSLRLTVILAEPALAQTILSGSPLALTLAAPGLSDEEATLMGLPSGSL